MTDILKTMVKTTTAGAFVGGSLFTAGLGLAHAQPVEAPDGLVTVAVGDATILEGVDTNTAADAASAICGAPVADVSALAQRVDAEGAPLTVCEGLPGGTLAIQNAAPVPAQPQAADSGEGTQSAPEGESDEGAPADSAPSEAGDAGETGEIAPAETG
ncbi:hypothetical protein E4P42_24655 [Mycobacterium sp. PS03-16]|uniref:hypothetical protein n=1 Tax=Mycobacterium sp. PS03-16 TaxID=2559611 RepID=UPI001072EE9D|nr:hypothetical protein [Mycobacterium sp. PS03-16]TFV54840.1 hypothetical protein E4P42_24655 [Mycobacterium sp. PS03-16]